MTDVLEQPTDTEFPEGSGPVVNRDGTVRRKPGPKPGTRRKSATPAAGKRAPSPGPRLNPAPRKPSSADYRPAILGLLQLPQLGLSLAAKFVKSDELRTALVLDGMTVGVHSGNVAEALNTTAQHDEKLAKVLDKLSTVGPYSLVISALMVPVFQVLANHGAVAPNPAMGILAPDELVATAQAMAG